MNKINIADKQKSFIACGALILTAVIWGLSYSAQAKAMDHLQPLVFVALRYFAGAFLILIPALLRLKSTPFDKKIILPGMICGFCLAGGEIIQQYGLLYTSAGKAGFLTALYVIMIPVIGVFIRKKSSLLIWTAAILSVAGSYMLCFTGTLEAISNKGDFLMILCALFFAFQFIAIAKFAPDADTLQLSFVQFLTVAVISSAAALIAGESWSSTGICGAMAPLLYCGLIAIGLACTVQVGAQKYVHPATASIILSLASVFAVIWGCLLLGEKYSVLNLAGCAVILTAVILVQLPERKEKN